MDISNLSIVNQQDGDSREPSEKKPMASTHHNVSGVYCSIGCACPILTATRGVKTTGLLIIGGQCVGRFDSAGVVRGEHQVIITDNRLVFHAHIEMYALKGTKVVLLNADGETEHCYRVGV